jgi:hypothetical protein
MTLVFTQRHKDAMLAAEEMSFDSFGSSIDSL